MSAAKEVNVLMIGDIVGSPGRKGIVSNLKQLRQEFGLDYVVACGENAAGGLGLTPELAIDLLRAGVDVITGGNHIWKRKELLASWDSLPQVLRGANYPAGTPGPGHHLGRTKSGVDIAVINLEGRLFMRPLDCPFRTADRLIEDLKKKAAIILVDFHAEATSEKRALGWYLDGRVSACVGTHTHVQTADEEILPGGTAYLTDLGLTGPAESVIGMRKEQAIQTFLTQRPVNFQVAKRQVKIQGVVLRIASDGRALSIERINRPAD